MKGKLINAGEAEKPRSEGGLGAAAFRHVMLIKEAKDTERLKRQEVGNDLPFISSCLETPLYALLPP